MGRINLNSANAIRYIQSLKVTQLDGLWNAINQQMESLGVEVNKRATKAHAYDGEPTGNLRSLTSWVQSLSKDSTTKEDKSNLQTLHAVIRVRFTQAGYTPKAPDAEALT